MLAMRVSLQDRDPVERVEGHRVTVRLYCPVRASGSKEKASSVGTSKSASSVEIMP